MRGGGVTDEEMPHRVDPRIGGTKESQEGGM